MKKGKITEKESVKRVLFDYVLITLGTFMVALGISVFLAPNKLSPGGVTAVGTVLLHLFKIRLSITNLVINAILFILGYRYLGKNAVIKTVYGIVALSVFLEVASLITSYTGDVIISSITGGILMGVGVGLVIRREGSTGGSDFAALILNRFFPHISTAKLIMVIDGVIITVAGIVFKSIEVTFYSAITLFVATRVADAICTLGNAAKTVQIFSEKNEEIAQMILHDLNRGITGVHCRGMYSDREGMMLLCVVPPKQLPIIINRVRKIDKSAFIVVNDTKEVLGQGFALESSYDKIN
ncbi:MAG: YitT family protein [Ruminococcaceae bacterium]|nr:YitT family protein [Oscillospiraceae bacterium]